MSGSVNKVILIGNLGRDVEVRTFSNGGKVANLRIATSERWRDKASGEQKERTEWHQVTLQGDGLVRIAEQYLSNGSKAYIEGKLLTRKWQDQSGQDRYSTEVVVGMGGALTMLDSAGGGRRDDDPSGPRNDAGGYGGAGAYGAPASGGVPDMEDSIPFAPMVL